MSRERVPIRYSYPVHSLDESDSYEGLKRQANAVRARRRAARKAPRAIPRRCEFLRDIIPPAAFVGGCIATLYAVFWLLAHFATTGVMPGS